MNARARSSPRSCSLPKSARRTVPSPTSAAPSTSRAPTPMSRSSACAPQRVTPSTSRVRARFPDWQSPGVDLRRARSSLGVDDAGIPARRPGPRAARRLVILEDTDRDGRADRHTVFADDLYVPTGFELGHGGVTSPNSRTSCSCAIATVTTSPTSARSCCTALGPRTATTPSAPSPGGRAARCTSRRGRSTTRKSRHHGVRCAV